MKQAEFFAYLRDKGQGIDKYYVTGKVLGLNAINDIVRWAKGVEKVFEVDLDNIVTNPEETKKLLSKIHATGDVSGKQEKNFIASVQAYYEFVNNNELT